MLELTLVVGHLLTELETRIEKTQHPKTSAVNWTTLVNYDYIILVILSSYKIPPILQLSIWALNSNLTYIQIYSMGE